jgi:hypothetical protein
MKTHPSRAFGHTVRTKTHQRWLLYWLDGYQQGQVSVMVTVTVWPSLQE